MRSLDAAPTVSITKRRFERSEHTAEEAGSAGSAPPVRRIVLTGGPGSGKSTAASFLAREFADEVWVLPEAATLLYRGGLPRGTCDHGTQIAQRAIFGVQRALEASAVLSHPGRTLLCDRATIDGAAYWPDGERSFFRSMGTTLEREIARYDAVIFMHSAALLPAGYERDIEVRTEDVAEAIELDARMRELYSSHPSVVPIESQRSFLDKLAIVRNVVADLVDRRPVGHAGRPDHSSAVPISSLANLAAIDHLVPAAR